MMIPEWCQKALPRFFTLCTQYVKSPVFYITLLAFTYIMRIKQ